MKKIGLLFLVFLIALVPLASADTFISNSRDWRDVYSVMVYGGISDVKPRFLVSEKHGSLILNAIPLDDHLTVFTSSKEPYVIGYGSIITNAGFQSVIDTKYSNMNIEIAEELENVTDFIVLDDAYGYNAIAVAPYAVLTKSYVIFADSTNIGDVVDLLESKDVNSLIIYGHVDREVRESLDEFNPEIINKDGDRFANNVEIVKKYMEVKPYKQVVLTNGEFIESEIMSGAEPVLFIGKENVPDKIREYIKSTDIEVGVLIGNELVGTATIVRRQVGISTFVKFAQGSRSSAGQISQVEGLDRFPVPSVSLSVEILSVKYNKLTGMVEITFKNNADIASYFKGTYTLNVGGEKFVFGDEDIVFIGKKDVKTMVYKVDGVTPEGEMTLDAYVIYGESRNALEFVIDETFTVSIIDVGDEAQIDITKLQYDRTTNKFLITLENMGEVDVYVAAELVDLIILGEKLTISSDETAHIKVGESVQSIVRAELSDSDLEDNPKVHVLAHYGEREGALIKIIEGDFEISIKSFDMWTWMPVLLIVLLVLLFVFGRKNCKSCGHKNPRSRTHCKKCGHKL